MELEVEEKPVAEESVTANTTSSVPEEIPVDEPSGEESASANVPSNQTPNLRRSTRNRRKPDWYSHNLTLLSTERPDPTSVDEVNSSPDKHKWRRAMEKEMAPLQSNEVWELVEPPPN